jgi:hypothetical protein
VSGFHWVGQPSEVTRPRVRGGSGVPWVRCGRRPGATNPISAPVLASVVAASVAQIRLLNGEIARLERDGSGKPPTRS